MSFSRRRFLARSAASGLALPLLASRRLLGANDELHVVIVGCGGRGQHHVDRMGTQPGVRIVGVCDPDRAVAERTAASVERKFKYKPLVAVDMRVLFDRKDVHAVSNATQNYWHGLSTIWACQAGKHVYCEKPLSHYIWEGRQMVNAARKYNCLVQHGTQQRSRRATAEAIAWLQSGQLGKVQAVTCFANKPRVSVGKRTEPLALPDSLDYDLWCGPAKKLPIYRDKLQYDCSFDFNTGGGEFCNQGVHELDVARWLLGAAALPRRVMAIGGRFVFNDAADAPNTEIVYFDFPQAPMMYEVHNLRAAKGSKEAPTFRGYRVGVVADCEGGSMAITQESSKALDRQGKEIKSWKSGETHFENFVDAVRSGARERLTADVLEGHLSARLCHLGQASYRLGEAAPLAQQRKALEGIAVWQEMHDRYLAHLAAHEIDPATSTLGPWLECDESVEGFKDNAKANELARGYYREPFVVPHV